MGGEGVRAGGRRPERPSRGSEGLNPLVGLRRRSEGSRLKPLSLFHYRETVFGYGGRRHRKCRL
jgi:hypothetical protein